MTQVTAAAAAVHFGARHPVTAIDGRTDRALDRREEAWPPGAALELPLGDKQRLIARRRRRTCRRGARTATHTSRDTRCRDREAPRTAPASADAAIPRRSWSRETARCSSSRLGKSGIAGFCSKKSTRAHRACFSIIAVSPALRALYLAQHALASRLLLPSSRLKWPARNCTELHCKSSASPMRSMSPSKPARIAALHERLKASDLHWLRGARIKYGADIRVHRHLRRRHAARNVE